MRVFCLLFQFVPSDGMVMIGAAVDGAESSFNGVDGVREIGTHEIHCLWSELSVIIEWYVVLMDTSTSIENINTSLPACAFKVCKGEWIITLLVNYGDSCLFRDEIDDLLRWCTIMKGFRVELKKGEEWKSLDVINIIIDRLHFFSR
ncbi:hypothetical protein SUGI_0911860 [Cryptomeria japonica]|nr:hypothetical protein SUGI_0911860 [Cryptomeria japonica]